MRQFRGSRLVWQLLAAALALPLTQVGHTLAYLGRYGWQGLRLESIGVHAYFPELVRLSGCGVGLVLLTGLLLAAAGRLLIGRGLGLTPTGGQPVPSLFAVAAIIQFDCYLVQETVETLLAHQPFTFATLFTILVWGLVGQLPLAAALACTVAWLSVRWRALGAGFRRVLELYAACLAMPPPVVCLRRGPQLPAPCALEVLAGQALLKRGPPSLSGSR